MSDPQTDHGGAAPLLSVVIPSFNMARWIEAAVQSVLDQTLRDLEVVVVDDGSTDATPQILAAIPDKRLRVVRQTNGGLAAARNTGIRAARGVFLGLLDGDDTWMPQKAERQVAVLQRDPGLTLTYSHSAYLDEDGTPSGLLLRSDHAAPDWRDMILRNHVGNGSTPIGRTADFIEAGLFNEQLRTAAEDYEMWPRMMHRTGRRIALVPEVLTGYRVRNSSSSMQFDGFLRQARLARDLLREGIPEAPAALLDLGLAGSYRIAARKAAAMGRGGEALRYLATAARIAPRILVQDPRFLGTLALALMGGRGQRGLHSVMRLTLGNARA